MRPLNYKILFLLLALLAACSPTPQPIAQPQTIQNTVIVKETVIVQETVIVERIITATPLPPTPTLAVTPTPAFALWTTQQVVDAFLSAGLVADSPHPMTKDDYGMAPMLAIEATRFLIPSICETCGGRIFSFEKQADLDTTKAYYDAFSQASAAFFSWTFVQDNILVQINGELPEADARLYEAALQGIQH